MKDVRQRKSLALWLAAAAAGITLVLTGCEENREMAEAESILAPIFKRTTPAEAAAWATDEFDADKRYRGTMMLANAPWGGEETYVRLYEVHLNDEAPAVRAAGLRGLTLHGSSTHVPRIAPLLSDGDVLVRLEATRALQRLHDAAAIPALLLAIRNPAASKAGEFEVSTDVRALAADALGQYADGRVVDGLVASLADPDLLVVRNAERSLKTLTGQSFGEDRAAWVRWLKGNTQVFAGRVPYVYPVFQRDKRWFEYIPLVPDPPFEPAGTPVGTDLAVAPGQ